MTISNKFMELIFYDVADYSLIQVCFSIVNFHGVNG